VVQAESEYPTNYRNHPGGIMRLHWSSLVSGVNHETTE